MCKIKIDGEVIEAESGKLLSEILIENKIKAEHPCGGKGTCRKCTVFVDGEEVLSCQYKVMGDITVTLPEQSEIHSESGVAIEGKTTDNMCLCLDIGTTTLALALVSLDTKSVVKVITATNPQRVFGADIMSRIDYCRKNGVETLHKALISEINNMIDGIGVKNPLPMFVSGNTTMLHTFFGVDCSSIGVLPYKAQFLDSRKSNGKDLGLTNVTEVVSLPGIHSFVGADLVAGLNCIKLPSDNKYSLLVDLGTNAEILLFSKDKVLCTAAAAGPCFEGANISCGMSATDGAIFAYSKGVFQTIGGSAPKGICGTGLIDIIAYLLTSEEIDETGYMESAFLVADKVYLTPEDVRQYQLAKSAVYSAIESLLKKENIDYSSVENLYISGGFSAKINIANAVLTGLLPRELKDKTIPLNNSSLQGVIKYVLENKLQEQLLRNAEYIDLSADKIFSGLFMENMMFDI